MTLSLEKTEALAPDQGSVDTACKLLKPAHWPKLAANSAMPKRMTRSTLIQHLLIGFLALFLLQAGMQAVPQASSVSEGSWGGEHMILEVSAKGAEIELDCAHGEITQHLSLDRHGNFDVAGTFAPEHGGPLLRDENTPPKQARYSGHVDGNTMSLTVTAGKEKVGMFTLTRGSHPLLRKCR